MQAGDRSLRDRIAAASTEAGSLVLLYVPDKRVVKVLPGAWPATATATWFDPRTGGSRPAGSAVVSPMSWEWTAPSAGDWVLVVQAQK
jgi:hypothetical protein